MGSDNEEKPVTAALLSLFSGTLYLFLALILRVYPPWNLMMISSALTIFVTFFMLVYPKHKAFCGALVIVFSIFSFLVIELSTPWGCILVSWNRGNEPIFYTPDFSLRIFSGILLTLGISGGMIALLHKHLSRIIKRGKIVYSSILIGIILALSFVTVIFCENSPSIERFVHYVPPSGAVDLAYWKENGTSYIYARATFGSSGYNVSSWGTPFVVGNNIEVNADIWRWTGGALAVITHANHVYDLGVLEPGNYTFTFKVWNERVKTMAFTVPLEDTVEWIPYVPSMDEVFMWYENPKYIHGAWVPEYKRVYVGIISEMLPVLPPGVHNPSNWGTPTINGNHIEVNAEIWRWTGPTFEVQPYSHYYGLDTLEPGNYTFTFKVWDAPVKIITFTVSG